MLGRFVGINRRYGTWIGIYSLILILFVCASIASPEPAINDDGLPAGCHPAMLHAVQDGDTIRAYYRLEPPQDWHYATIRIRGVDTAARGSRALCQSEKDLGREAAAYLKARLHGAHLTSLLLRVCDARPVANSAEETAEVYLKQNGKWRNAADVILASGLAVIHKGGPRHAWCD